MRAKVVISTVLLICSVVACAQQKNVSQNDSWQPIKQMFPKTREKKDGTRSPQLYTNSWLTLSNYGPSGVLILGLGDEFNGPIATYKVCDKWAIYSVSGYINWNDGTGTTTNLYFIPPVQSGGQAGTTHTPAKSGTYAVTGYVSSSCGDWWQGGTTSDQAMAKATAYIYESIPITNFIVNCGTNSPCTTIKGGQLASGVVTTQTTAPPGSIGTIVRIATSGAGSALPYVIETTGLSTVSFDVLTAPVTVNTPLMISVNSGGTTVSQVITVTP